MTGQALSQRSDLTLREGAMPAQHIHHPAPIHDGLHPLVYRTMIALIVWLVLSAWVFFDSGAYVGLTLAMITVFFAVITAIPLLIWKTWQHNAPPAETRPEDETFREWRSDEFATSTGTLSGREAAMQILLPIAAVSIGMFIFGLVFYLDVPHGTY
jgi:hypothetical protein